MFGKSPQRQYFRGRRRHLPYTTHWITYALRMHKLEPQHPLRIRTRSAYSSTILSRFERLVQKCPVFRPSIGPAAMGGHLFGGSDSCLVATGGTGNKKEAAEKFNAWLKAQNPLDIIVYTDGSQETNQDNTPTGTGAGWVLNWVGSWFSKQGISLGNTYEIYNAKAIAMLEGLKQALSSPMARVAHGIHICLDNLGVARKSSSIPEGSSQETFKQFRNLAKE